MFLNTLETLIQKSPNDCPFIVLGDFNINILDDSNHKNNKQQLIDLMNKLELKSQFKNIITKVELQLDHI
jgi:meiotically up-regulated gene 157 (Mug157) protein